MKPMLWWLVVLLGGSGPAMAAGADCDDAVAARGRATLRAMDCARCHGGDYRGSSGPSLREAVRDGPRERFDRMVLDGDIVRGMPGYRSQPRVVDDLDAIYAYLRADACPRAPAVAVPIEPGQYDVTIETVLPHLEENLRYATTRQRQCLCAQDPTLLFPLLRHAAYTGCTLTGGRARDGDVEYDLTCRNPEAATGIARITAGPDALHAVLDIKMGGKNMTLSQRIHAPRIGACKGSAR